MSTQDFRSAVFGAVEAWRGASFSAVPAFYENGPTADEASVGPLWLDVSMRWYSAAQITVESAPRGRHTGALSLQVYYRAGEGTAQVDAVIDSAIAALRCRRYGSGLLYMPQRSVPVVAAGWHKSGLFIPFHVDD